MVNSVCVVWYLVTWLMKLVTWFMKLIIFFNRALIMTMKNIDCDCIASLARILWNKRKFLLTLKHAKSRIICYSTFVKSKNLLLFPFFSFQRFQLSFLSSIYSNSIQSHSVIFNQTAKYHFRVVFYIKIISNLTLNITLF